mgnify:FL=1
MLGKRALLINSASIIGILILILDISLPFYRSGHIYWGSIYELLEEMTYTGYYYLGPILYVCGLLIFSLSLIIKKRRSLIRGLGALLSSNFLLDITDFFRGSALRGYTEYPVELAYGAYVYLLGLALIWFSVIATILIKAKKGKPSKT